MSADAFRRAMEDGRLDDAVASAARELGRAYAPGAPLSHRFKPEQDLLYSSSWREKSQREGDARALSIARAYAARRPRDGAALTLLGILLQYVGDLRASERVLGRAARRWPRSPWPPAWRFACRTLLARAAGDPELGARAKPDLDRALELDPAHDMALCLRAELFHDRERYEDALNDLERVLARDPQHAWALCEKGEILTERGRIGPALACFDLLVRRHPGRAWPLAMRARARANYGRAGASLRDFDRAVALAPRWPALRAWRGEARRKTGDYRGAVSDFNACLKEDPGYLVARAWRGHAQLLRGRPAAALKDLDAAVVSDCRQMLFYAWRGEARFKLGRWKDAADDFDRCHPFHPRLSWSPDPGSGLDREGVFWRDLDRAARRGGPWARALRGRFLVDSPRRAEALRVLGEAARAPSARAWAAGWFGEALRRDGRLEEARACLEASAALAPRSWLTRARLARTLLDLGPRRRALPHAREAWRLRPDHPFAHAVLGEALTAAGRSKQARRHLEAARWLTAGDEA